MHDSVGPILSLTFANPWLLVGLSSVAIPIVLHLLRRQPREELQWAAMQFLRAAVSRTSRRRRWQQWSVLAARVLALTLLVVALAGPQPGPRLGAGPKLGTRHSLIVLDDSCSMGYRFGMTDSPDSPSSFSRARQIADSVIQAGRAGDTWSLVTTCASNPPVFLGWTFAERQAALERIERLAVTDQRADLPHVSERIPDLLTRADRGHPTTGRRIIVISDFQATTWIPKRPDQQAPLKTALRRLSATAELTLIDVGTSDAENTAVVDVRAEKPFAFVGERVPVTVTLHHFGRELRHGLDVHLDVDGRRIDSKPIDLPPDADVTLSFVCPIDTLADHRLEVRTGEDRLPADNVRWSVLPTRASLRVLLADGRPVASRQDRAAFFVERALAPPGMHAALARHVQVAVARNDQLASMPFGEYDCIFLCDVGGITAEVADRLRLFVNRGGGLVIGLGDNVAPARYNQLLFDSDSSNSGLLPARLGALVGDPSESSQLFRLTVASLDQRVRQAFRSFRAEGLSSAAVFAYRRADASEDPGSQVLLSFDTGDPAILEKSVGAGRSILITTSVDRQWGAWPVWAPTFVPLMHELVAYAASGRAERRNVLVGDPISVAAGKARSRVDAVVERPDDHSTAAAAEPGFVRYKQTDVAGCYTVRWNAPAQRSRLFAVNVAPEESDLRKLTPDQISSQLPAGARYTYGADWQIRSSLALPSAATPHALTAALLLAAVVVLMTELLLQRWYGTVHSGRNCKELQRSTKHRAV